MTLGVLAPWRRRGVGKQLLLRILSNLARYPSVGEVYLHVQTSNHEAVKFYEVSLLFGCGIPFRVYCYTSSVP